MSNERALVPMNLGNNDSGRLVIRQIPDDEGEDEGGLLLNSEVLTPVRRIGQPPQQRMRLPSDILGGGFPALSLQRSEPLRVGAIIADGDNNPGGARLMIGPVPQSEVERKIPSLHVADQSPPEDQMDDDDNDNDMNNAQILSVVRQRRVPQPMVIQPARRLPSQQQPRDVRAAALEQPNRPQPMVIQPARRMPSQQQPRDVRAAALEQPNRPQPMIIQPDRRLPSQQQPRDVRVSQDSPRRPMNRVNMSGDIQEEQKLENAVNDDDDEGPLWNFDLGDLQPGNVNLGNGELEDGIAQEMDNVGNDDPFHAEDDAKLDELYRHNDGGGEDEEDGNEGGGGEDEEDGNEGGGGEDEEDGNEGGGGEDEEDGNEGGGGEDEEDGGDDQPYADIANLLRLDNLPVQEPGNGDGIAPPLGNMDDDLFRIDDNVVQPNDADDEDAYSPGAGLDDLFLRNDIPAQEPGNANNNGGEIVPPWGIMDDDDDDDDAYAEGANQDQRIGQAGIRHVEQQGEVNRPGGARAAPGGLVPPLDGVPAIRDRRRGARIAPPRISQQRVSTRRTLMLTAQAAMAGMPGNSTMDDLKNSVDDEPEMKQVGAGTRGRIYAAEIDSVPVAIKDQKKGDCMPDELRASILAHGIVLARQCPHFALVYRQFVTNSNQSITVREGGDVDLFNFFRDNTRSILTHADYISLIFQAFTAVLSIHTLWDVIHNDAKLSNMIVTLLEPRVSGEAFRGDGLVYEYIINDTRYHLRSRALNLKLIDFGIASGALMSHGHRDVIGVYRRQGRAIPLRVYYPERNRDFEARREREGEVHVLDIDIVPHNIPMENRDMNSPMPEYARDYWFMLYQILRLNGRAHGNRPENWLKAAITALGDADLNMTTAEGSMAYFNTIFSAQFLRNHGVESGILTPRDHAQVVETYTLI